ncbi:MAG: hypothetical protein JXB38_02635 [Anaerolineales bacterium]|nr:hypothetical protein [Anaerolineales bacterium]
MTYEALLERASAVAALLNGGDHLCPDILPSANDVLDDAVLLAVYARLMQHLPDRDLYSAPAEACLRLLKADDQVALLQTLHDWDYQPFYGIELVPLRYPHEALGDFLYGADYWGALVMSCAGWLCNGFGWEIVEDIAALAFEPIHALAAALSPFVDWDAALEQIVAHPKQAQRYPLAAALAVMFFVPEEGEDPFLGQLFSDDLPITLPWQELPHLENYRVRAEHLEDAVPWEEDNHGLSWLFFQVLKTQKLTEVICKSKKS